MERRCPITSLPSTRGTTSARAIVFDREARETAVDQRPFASRFPRGGWVEQDPEEIWLTQLAAARNAVEKSGVGWDGIAAIGITNQRETTIVWDRATGEPIAPAIVWQCRRTAGACRKMTRAGHAARIAERTGLVLDAYFSGSKIAWILENVPDARARAEAGELAFGTVDTWLIYRLTGGRAFVIDRTNASRTLLMNLRAGEWDGDMLSLFGRAAGHAARDRPFKRRGGGHRCAGARRGDSRGGHCRRSAGRLVRSGVLPPRLGEKHLRHGLFRLDAYRRPSRGFAQPPAGDDRGGGIGGGALRHGRRRFRCRRGRPMAARRDGADRHRRRVAASRGIGGRYGGGLFRSGIRRPRSAALERGCPRAAQRIDPRREPRAHRQGPRWNPSPTRPGS